MGRARSFNYFRDPADKGYGTDGEKIETFDKYLFFGQGTVPWHEVDHPLYGKIEVGGRKKQWQRYPPSFLLEEECHRNMAFTLYHADQMPQVEIQSVEVKPLAGGLVEVTAVVANRKLIPHPLGRRREEQDHPARPDRHQGKGHQGCRGSPGRRSVVQ